MSRRARTLECRHCGYRLLVVGDGGRGGGTDLTSFSRCADATARANGDVLLCPYFRDSTGIPDQAEPAAKSEPSSN
jgi:hypothetical protein